MYPHKMVVIFAKFYPQPLSVRPLNAIESLGAPRRVRIVSDVEVALSSEPSTFGSAYRPAGTVVDA